MLKLVSDINILFDSGTGDKISKEQSKLNAQGRIIQLSYLYRALYNLLVERGSLNVWLEVAGEKPIESENLNFYIEQAEKITGFKVNGIDDLARLAKEIERYVDKFKEIFNDEKTDSGEGITFMQLVLGVFSMMTIPYNGNMKLSAFAEMKEIAEGRSIEYKKQLEKVKR